MFRLKLVAARDGLLPTFLSGIHNDFYTPVPAILIQVSKYVCMYIRTYVYINGMHDVSNLLSIKTHGSESRGQEELFTRSTALKFANALAKPPRSYHLVIKDLVRSYYIESIYRC